MRSYTYKEALALVDDASFMRLPVETRVSVFQSVETQMACEQSRAARQVVAEPLPYGVRGEYRHGNKTISLNRDYIENSVDGGKSLVSTVVHEGRHAYQHDACDGLVCHENTAELLTWRENQRSYIDPRVDFLGYAKQPLEQSAREYSAGRCAAMPMEREVVLREFREQGIDVGKLGLASERGSERKSERGGGLENGQVSGRAGEQMNEQRREWASGCANDHAIDRTSAQTFDRANCEATSVFDEALSRAARSSDQQQSACATHEASDRGLAENTARSSQMERGVAL